MIDSQRHNDTKISLRYFNMKDGIIHPTEKTEIELDYEVNIMQWNKWHLNILKNLNNICLWT